MIKKALALSFGVLFALTSCGGGSGGGGGTGQTTTVRFVLSFRPNSDCLPYAVGIKEGYYKAEGLDVQIEQATDPTSPLKTVAAGSDQMGYGFGPDLLFAADKGLPLVSVYSVLQTASFGIVSLASSNIHSPADLKGKRVGITSIPIDQVSFGILLASAGLTTNDIKPVDVGFTGEEQLLAGHVDAISGLTWGEGADYTLAGKSWNFMAYHDYGVPDYPFEVIIVNRQFLQQNPAAVRAFLRATTKAINFGISNPQKGVQDLVAEFPDLKADQKSAVWAAITKDITSPLAQQNGVGYQDVDQWIAVSTVFVEHHLISKAPDFGQLVDNSYYKG